MECPHCKEEINTANWSREQEGTVELEDKKPVDLEIDTSEETYTCPECDKDITKYVRSS